MDAIDLRQIRYFVAVAEELHFHRAAERLHISQPSLSAQIRQLERRLGVELLSRTSRRVTLTPPGETLLRDGRELLAHAEQVVVATRRSGAGRLSVGFYGSAAIELIPGVLERFAADHPTLEVTFRELPFGKLAQHVGTHVDVAFTRLLPEQVGPDLSAEVLAQEARVVALPAAHRLAGRRSLRYRTLREEAFIVNPAIKGEPPTRWLDEQREHGLDGRIAAEAGSLEELLTLVASGRGIGLVPASVARHYPRTAIRYVPVADARPAVISIVWRRGPQHPELPAFIETAKRVAAAWAGAD